MTPPQEQIAKAAGWNRCEYPHKLAEDMWHHADSPLCADGKYASTEEMLAALYKEPFYLFADTETTGLPAKGAYGDPTHPDTPHLVELAGILKDSTGQEYARLHCIVKPDGYEIPAEASSIHGITQERALTEGIPLWRAMWQFERLLNKASALVFHNHQFDRLILKASHLRLDMPHRFREVQRVCTMMSSTKHCRLPTTNGRGGFKWPTLTEAHRHFLGTEFEDAHGAIADAEACSRVFFHMKANGLI